MSRLLETLCMENGGMVTEQDLHHKELAVNPRTLGSSYDNRAAE